MSYKGLKDGHPSFAPLDEHILNFPHPISNWDKTGPGWPTEYSLRNLMRPENKRDELLKAGVIARVHGRWVIFPNAWIEYCKNTGHGRGD